ncbi:hypothetical protein IEQ34_001605 [Dendrobium chrysotoxum]|uniref:F-box domain-containing protein n=1 Tax=Dendrobium chrysotoxum TaxID=161865 RepID=A0AAV7HNR3_DENCH|nr:hypothetical protein IEQ34_001605 [Dendrobium chrysotoxum]
MVDFVEISVLGREVSHSQIRQEEKETMGRGEDRISCLPESVLQSILTMMPLKSAIRTDVLSKKWRNLWKYSLSTATELDFGQDLVNNLSAIEFVETVNRYLSLHVCKKLERFHVFFSPFDLFASDIQRWISYAIGKGVRYLDIDLSQGFKYKKFGEFTHGRSPFELPSSLFDCDSLIDLSLCCCNFNTPLNLSHFGGLQSLSLSHSNISEEMLQSFLTVCSLLESLSLRSCQQLGAISIMVPNLKLKRLIIRDCRSVDLLVINAPKLQSFHYFGRLCIQTQFLNISSLKDASICSNIRYWRNMSLLSDILYVLNRRNVSILSDLLHVQILTLCSGALMHLNEFEGNLDIDLPLKYQNLRELQLLMNSMTNEDLTCFYKFFYLCSFPFVEKLCIQLPKHIDYPNEEKYGGWMSLKCNTTFDRLKVIKITNFKGSSNEMSLVSSLLQKAAVLETLVLVIRPAKESNGEGILDWRILKGEVLLLQKASPTAQIILHEFGEDDDGLNSTHLEIYNYYNNENFL